MDQIGFHTDAFNSAYWSFEQALAWAGQHGVPWIECGAIDGVSWIHGLGYQPHIALWEDPVLLRRKMDRYGVQFSQVDAAFPLSRPEGATLGVEYVLHTIRWAKLAGCTRIDTTDDRVRPDGLTDRQALEHLREIYLRILHVAEAYEIIVNIEPHGYYTTKPEFLSEMLNFADSPCLALNMDLGNTFIAGQDPVAMTETFLDRISHVHLKDIGADLAAEARGELTGVAGSPCALGDGVNAQNVRAAMALLLNAGYRGVFSLECEAHGGPMLERSLAWARAELSGRTKS
ncbi:MAG TPA: hypothetical protein DEH78_03175 [Solibacterales bacterium]|nr:hypothetical protein [Bryobacterales bacterium]